MKKIRTLTILVALVLLAAACGDDSSAVGTSSGDDPDGAGSDTTGDPGGGNPGDATVAVQVLVDGGFVPVEVALRTVPQLTVTTDGTVITAAPVLAIYPGPAITPLQAVSVDAADIESLLARAGELGLLDGELDFGQPPVTDVPNTTVTIVADGTTYTHVANALDLQFEDGDPGFSTEVAANRAALSEFVRAAQSLGVGDRAWVPSAIGVTVVGPYQPLDEPADPDAFEWTLSTALETQGSFPCTVVTGDDATALLELLSAANERTPWLVDGEPLSLAFRPVVPGQQGCP